MKTIKWLVKELINKLFPLKRNSGKLNKDLSGIKKDKIDDRDYNAKSLVGEFFGRPEKQYLAINPKKYVKDQGQWNSCGSHAMATALEIAYDLADVKFSGIELSERFHYRLVRELNGKFPKNDGQTLRDALKIAQEHGICPERLCPYISEKMNDPLGSFTKSFAKWWRVKHYYRIWFLDQIKDTLLMNRPVIIGVKINASFKRFSGPIEVTKGERTYGGHGIVIYGYDSTDNTYHGIINSWGKYWKNEGIVKLPEEYLKEYLLDAYTFTIVE